MERLKLSRLHFQLLVDLGGVQIWHFRLRGQRIAHVERVQVVAPTSPKEPSYLIYRA